MKEPDYLQMWQDLTAAGGNSYSTVFQKREKAEEYDSATKRKNQDRRDALIDLVTGDLKPGYTVLDIGAGTGRWTVPLARTAARVTAVDPSDAMLTILKRNAADAGVADKIDIITSTWEDAAVGVFDFVLSFHAVYMSRDFVSFIRKMEAHAGRRCYLGLRHFPIDGIVQELALKIHGTIHDSPNFIIGYHALYQMGIYANVTIEEFRHNWRDDSFDTAFQRAKRHLRLENETKYDALIRETLKRRLSLSDGKYLWPDSMSTAMVWWEPQHK